MMFPDDNCDDHDDDYNCSYDDFDPLHCFTIVSAFKVDVAGGRVNETPILGPRELNLVRETQMIIDDLIM